MDTKAGIDPFFTRESLRHTGAMYRAGADPHQPTLSPAVHADLTGFPPMLLQAGTNEVLLDDSTRMAARARAAGVDVILDITADVTHALQTTPRSGSGSDLGGQPVVQLCTIDEQRLDRARTGVDIGHDPVPDVAGVARGARLARRLDDRRPYG